MTLAEKNNKPWILPLSRKTEIAAVGLFLLTMPVMPVIMRLSGSLKLALSGSMLITALVCVAVFRLAIPDAAKKFGVKKPRPRDLPALLFFYVFTYISAVAVSILWQKLLNLLALDYAHEQPLVKALADTALSGKILIAVSVCIFSPLLEELVFRRVIYSLLLPCGTLPAIVLTGLVFSLAHGFLAGIPGLWVMGAAFQLIYLKTGNIVMAAALHSLLNLTAFLFAVLF